MRFASALAAALALGGPVTAAPTLRLLDDRPGPDGYSDESAFVEGKLLVARGDGVMAFDPASGTVTPGFVPGERVHAVAAAPGRDLAVSTNGVANTVTVFRPSTGEVVKVLASGGLKPDAATFEPLTGQVAVAHGRSGALNFVELSKPWIARSVFVGGALEGVAADGRGRLAVAVSDARALAVVDAREGRVVHRWRLPRCDEPSAVAVDGSRATALVACEAGVTLAVALDTGRVVSRLRGGSEVDAILADPAHGLWLSIAEQGRVTVIGRAPAGYRVLADLPVAPGARSGAFDPATRRLYLPSVRYVKTAAGDEAAPGSFRLRTYQLEDAGPAGPP